MDDSSGNSKKLALVLMSNAIFSILCAIDLIFLSNWVGSLIGIKEVLYLQLLGGGLVGFASFVFWVSRNLEQQKLVSLIIQLDRSWVVGSILLLLFASQLFSQLGHIIIGTVALIVLVFGELQNYFNKRTNAESLA